MAQIISKKLKWRFFSSTFTGQIDMIFVDLRMTRTQSFGLEAEPDHASKSQTRDIGEMEEAAIFRQIISLSNRKCD